MRHEFLSRRLLATLSFLLFALTGSAVPVSAETAEPEPQDGLAYPVSRIDLSYAKVHEDHPPISELAGVEVSLLRTDAGFVRPREGEPVEELRIDQIGVDGEVVLYGSAIRQIDEALVAAFNERGLVGVLARPASDDIDPASSRDERPAGDTALDIQIWTGRLTESRTFASGSRIAEEDRIDHPAHERIKKNSPAQPGDLLKKHDLERYVAKLSRHPGRNVDVTFSTAEEPGGVYLDYLVSESRPWSAYAQLSNTGTESTTKLRERFGFTHNQLSGNDDILKVDYITGDFKSLNAVFGSYKIPFGLGFLLPDSLKIPWIGDPDDDGDADLIEREFRVSPTPDLMSVGANGSWAKYDAADVGFQTSSFKGTQWDVGGEWSLDVFEGKNLYVNVGLGANYQHVDVDNLIGIFPQNGTANWFFLEPAVRLRYESETGYFNANLGGSFNLPSVAGTNTSDLNNGQLGRSNVSVANTRVARWEVELAFFLEPLLDPEGYNDPSTPDSSTLAHEIFLRNWGQYSGDRLIPQHERIAGGLRTVRGYPQAFIAGDTVVVSRGEYRLHIPRLFPIDPTPLKIPWIGDSDDDGDADLIEREFRVSPQQVYGAPDWDLILRAFIDAAQVRQVDIQLGEQDVDVIGLGLGLELQVGTHLIARVDWGNARTATDNVSKGRNEVYFAVTVIY